jgi:hypothetical protein
MGWVISQALMRDYENSRCLQVQAVESSAERSSGGEQSAPLSETPMPQAYLSNDRMKEFSRPSRSGMTFAPLTESLGEDVSMWCQEDSRAKTSAQQDEGQESTAKGPASGVKWRELFRKFDPATSSWRTHRCLFDADLPESSVILPRWGMMQDGALSERLTLALPTCERESGLWPTPRANDAEKRGNFDLANQRNGLAAAAKMWPTPNTEGYRSDGELKLLAEMVGDTPEFQAMSSRACQSKKRAALRRLGDGESEATMWPTPCASEGLDCGTNWASLAAVDRGGRIARRIATNGGPETQQTTHAQLNPAWVEWLMGWPIGWTDLGALETDRFLQWQRSHGVS